MTRSARLIGIEGRTIVDKLAVADGTREIRMPSFDRQFKWVTEDECVTYFNEVVYEFDLEAEDGTLIFRRTTPLWRNDV